MISKFLVGRKTSEVALGELSIRLRVAFTESFAVVIADKAAVSDDRIEPAMRKGVPPTRDQSVVEALPLFESLPASVYAAVAVMVEPLLSDCAKQ